MLLTCKGNDKNDGNVNKKELEVSQVAENLQKRLMINSKYIHDRHTAADDSINNLLISNRQIRLTRLCSNVLYVCRMKYLTDSLHSHFSQGKKTKQSTSDMSLCGRCLCFTATRMENSQIFLNSALLLLASHVSAAHESSASHVGTTLAFVTNWL